MILILMFLGRSNSMWKPWELRQELETSLIMRRIKSAQNHQEHIISSPGYYTSLITILRVHFHRWNKFCSNHFSKLFHIVDEGYMTVIVIWNGTPRCVLMYNYHNQGLGFIFLSWKPCNYNLILEHKTYQATKWWELGASS